jgi:hypothetical protein
VIIDAAEAQRADFSYRMLRFSFMGAATQWIFVAALLAVQEHKVSLAAVIPLAAVGATCTLWTIRSFTQRHRAIWFASESMTQIRVLISPHLRGFRLHQEGVVDDRAGTFSRQRRRPSTEAVSLAFAEV